MNTYSIKKYFNYLKRAKTKHGVHSPFVYKLVTEVFDDRKNYIEYQQAEELKKQLLKSTETIDITDLGAGSTVMNSSKRQLKDIAYHAGSSKKQGRLLNRLVSYFQPTTVLELGTSVGIGTKYLASGNEKSKIFTIEGCPNTADVAKKNLAALKNVAVYTGDFAKALPEILNQITTLDFVYIDGNHQKTPTIAYFEAILPKANNDTVFVFDDIYWSKEMTNAWEIIKEQKDVTLSIDLFHLGLIFIRKEQKKEHFIIRN